MDELRCQAKLHARLGDHTIEVKCSSRWCGAKHGTVVLHKFDASSGELVETLRFRDPVKEVNKLNGSTGQSTTVRSA